MSRFLVTGVSRGIGAETARALIEAGHQVFGVVRPGTEPPTGLAGHGVADLDEVDTLGAALAEFADRLADGGGLDGLVHSAGVALGSTLATTTAAELTAQFRLNVTAVAQVDQVFLPLLRRSAGTIVYVNSGSGLAGRNPLGGYAASKFALKGYADSLRLEEPAVRISSVYPGRVATDMQRDINAREGTSYDPSLYLRAETVASMIMTVLTLPSDGVITDLTLGVR